MSTKCLISAKNGLTITIDSVTVSAFPPGAVPAAPYKPDPRRTEPALKEPDGEEAERQIEEFLSFCNPQKPPKPVLLRFPPGEGPLYHRSARWR
jgi:hypothetical protein